MSNTTQAAPQYTAENSKPSKVAPTPDGVIVGKWVPNGYGQEKRRKVVFATSFIDCVNTFTGKRSQWWNQSQTHFTQRREIGDTTDRMVAADIWTRDRTDAQGLGIEAI